MFLPGVGTAARGTFGSSTVRSMTSAAGTYLHLLTGLGYLVRSMTEAFRFSMLEMGCSLRSLLGLEGLLLPLSDLWQSVGILL